MSTFRERYNGFLNLKSFDAGDILAVIGGNQKAPPRWMSVVLTLAFYFIVLSLYISIVQVSLNSQNGQANHFQAQYMYFFSVILAIFFGLSMLLALFQGDLFNLGGLLALLMLAFFVVSAILASHVLSGDSVSSAQKNFVLVLGVILLILWSISAIGALIALGALFW